MLKTNKTIYIFAATTIFIGFFFMPIKVPYAINSIAKILPARQWILSRGNDGEILTSTVNNISGINYSSRLYSCERGESIILNIDPLLKNGQFIEKGDTLGLISSSSQQENLIQLKGELEVLMATFKVNISGDKKTIVREAQERLAQAKVEFEKQNKVVVRLKPLYEKELIAEADYQTANDELNVLAKAVNVREAELESSLSGEKVEEINRLKKQIMAVENKLVFLQEQINSVNKIIAPFSGRIERTFSLDTLFVLSNIETGIALIPVSVEEAVYINKGKKVIFNLTGTRDQLFGNIQMKQPVMELIDGKQCIMVLATLHILSTDFISGIIAKAKINCGSVSLLTFIKRNIFN